jgi:hypothetical protein
MTDYVASMRDSIETSVSMRLFPSKDAAMRAHIDVSEPIKFPMSRFAKGAVDNFDSARLQTSAATAYPPKDRPRGSRDLSSVKFYVAELAAGREPQPIWVLSRENKFTLLDGAHRVVAAHIAQKKYAMAYLVQT